jgi:hypothetical protein
MSLKVAWYDPAVDKSEFRAVLCKLRQMCPRLAPSIDTVKANFPDVAISIQGTHVLYHRA